MDRGRDMPGSLVVCYSIGPPSYVVRMNLEQWIVWFSLLGSDSSSALQPAFSPIRRLYLATPAALSFLIFVYEIRMDRWEKTVSAPIRLDMFAEIPMMILCLAFGTWQIVLSRKHKAY